MKTNFFLLSVAILLLFVACESSFFGIRGSGSVTSQKIILEDIHAINMAIDADVYIIKGDTQLIEMEAQQNIIDNMVRNVNNGIWVIEFDKHVYKHEPIKIYITLPVIEDVTLSGSGNIFTDDSFEFDKIDLTLSGSGDIDFMTNTLVTNVMISGSGNVSVKGQTNVQDIIISGSGNYNAFEFLSSESDISITGSGNCRVNVSNNLKIDISGSGNVYYKGYPTINSLITGSGNVFDGN